ncbi:MAG: hypothetical protein LBM03_01105 [Erysipelotrichaceae bacterium]|jgi:hypothetical protein|nr:hypothetical protein [Erysipelotrichaceae bacterium]
MANFFKTFAKGILYVLVLPVLILVLAICASFSLIAFIFIGLKSIVLFFKGENMFGELPEDVEARRRKERIALAKQGVSIEKQNDIISEETKKEEPILSTTNESFIFTQYETTINPEKTEEIVKEETPKMQKAEQEDLSTHVKESNIIIENEPEQFNGTIFIKENNNEDYVQDDDIDITYVDKRRNK